VSPADRPADLVFVGGRIETIDPARSTVSALAVRDGRIVARGPDGAVRGLVGPRTRVINLRGRTLIPGFQDAHVHPISAELDAMRCNLLVARGAEGYLTVVDDYARTHPEDAWIRGGGWYMPDFPGGTPRREALDRVVPDRPVYLENRDGHGAWVNSRALAAAGIDAATPDPPDGRIERDPDGTPTGTLHESAIHLVARLLPADTQGEVEAALVAGQARLHAFGITAWQDARVSPDSEEPAYASLASAGRLSARVAGAMRWDPRRGLEQIEALVERRRAATVGHYAATSVKFFLDGVMENFTASMLEPYGDGRGGTTDNHGLRPIDPAVLAEAITRLDALGFQAHFHAIGDRAVRDALDAVETARRANGPSDTRPHIAHIQVIDPGDLPRFKGLGVAATAQAYWACHEDQMDDLTIPFIGDRWRLQYPFRSLRAAGALLAMGSDWSVSTPNPLLQIELAVERVWDGHRGGREPFLPDERIELVDALAAFTAGSAWVNHLDAETGSIEVGKAGDLAMLDRDLFDRSAGAIGEARVVATFVDGEPVYETPDLDG
jgi:hypothetical protein